MKNPPDFSVVITVYNKEKYIGELLKGCLNLVEICEHIKSIVIIDDCSTDSSWDVVSDFIENCESNLASRFRAERLAVNSGPQQARMKGGELAKSEWIISVDGDDMIYPSSVARICDYILENDSNLEHISLVYGNTFRILHNVSFEQIMQFPHKKNINSSYAHRNFFSLYRNDRPTMSGSFVRRRYLHEMNNNLITGEETLFFFRLMQYSQFLKLDIDVTAYRRHLPEGSRGSNQRMCLRPRLAVVTELFRVNVYKKTKSLSRLLEATVVRVLFSLSYDIGTCQEADNW